MAFKLYDNVIDRNSRTYPYVSIGDVGQIYISANILTLWTCFEYEYIDLYFDRKTSRVGIIPRKTPSKYSFKAHRNGSKNVRAATISSFLKQHHIKYEQYGLQVTPVPLDDKLIYVFKVERDK